MSDRQTAPSEPAFTYIGSDPPVLFLRGVVRGRADAEYVTAVMKALGPLLHDDRAKVDKVPEHIYPAM